MTQPADEAPTTERHFGNCIRPSCAFAHPRELAHNMGVNGWGTHVRRELPWDVRVSVARSQRRVFRRRARRCAHARAICS